jgi:hypothetical protein
MVFIIKANGVKTLFDINKVVKSFINVGLDLDEANSLALNIKFQLKDGMTTKQLHDLVFEKMKEIDKPKAHKYILREAVAKLNPEFHQFEKYIANVFRYHGYKTIWEQKPKPVGYCTDHEIDVTLEKDGVLEFIECKHHKHFHRYTGLDVPMRVFARLEDLKEGYNIRRDNSFPFIYAWVLTNTKVSEHAIQYAKCKNIRLIGWHYPQGGGLNHIIESVGAYPVTILNGIKANVVQKLYQHEIYDTKQFYKSDDKLLRKCGIDRFLIESLKSIAKELSSKGLKDMDKKLIL